MPPDRRPHFARDFPRTPALDALVEAFARGDYAHVRAEGPLLAETTQEENVRLAARTLVERTAPDPLAVWMLVLAGVLLAVMSGYWIARGKPPSASPDAPQAAPPGNHGP